MAAATAMAMPAAEPAVTQPASQPNAAAIRSLASACRCAISTGCGQDRERGGGSGLVRRGAAENADRPGRIYDLAQCEFHLSCRFGAT